MRHTMTVLMIVMLALVGGLQGQEGPYRLLKEIAVGGEGGWDYLSVDSAAGRLYVTTRRKPS